MERNKKGQFIKGTNGETYDGFGIWYDKKGYANIWINMKSIKLHIYIWKKANGEKLKGYDIHHKDFNKRNYKLSNLELLNKSDHLKIHAGWIRKNNKWILKPCKDCKKILPLDKFYQRKGLTPSNICIKCSLIMWKKKRKDKKWVEEKKKYLRNYYKNKKICVS